jgi:DNA-binding beta-propeller fold protein YncE
LVPVPPGSPNISIDVDFGESPVSGTLRIHPGSDSNLWQYRIEPIDPDVDVQEGELLGAITIPYRFESPGVYLIRVELSTIGDSIVFEHPVVVIDPDSDFEILEQRPVREIWPDGGASPEGIVLDPQGRWLYAADYRTGELVRIDPVDLRVADRLHLAPLVEGLAVSPSGHRLFAISKNSGLTVVDLNSFTATWNDGLSGHYIHAVDETHALIGYFGFSRINALSGETLDGPVVPAGRHFAVLPDGQRVAVLNEGTIPPTLELLELPSLASLRSIPLAGLDDVAAVAADPVQERAYVMGSDGGEGRFLLVDLGSGEVLESTPLGIPPCVSYCVANPTASFGAGRFIAFEWRGAVVVVDTELDRPRFRFQPGDPAWGGPAGVAAHPDSDILYVLGGSGPGPSWRLYKIRLRNS